MKLVKIFLSIFILWKDWWILYKKANRGGMRVYMSMLSG